MKAGINDIHNQQCFHNTKTNRGDTCSRHFEVTFEGVK